MAAEEHIEKRDHTNAPFAVGGVSVTSRALDAALKYSVINLLNEKQFVAEVQLMKLLICS